MTAGAWVCRIDWEDKSLPGAQRAVVVDVDKCRLLPSGSIPLKGGPVTDWSPHNPNVEETGAPEAT